MNILQEKINKRFSDKNLPFPSTWTWQTNERGVFYIDTLKKRRYGFIKNCRYCDREFVVRNDWKDIVVVCSRFCGHASNQNQVLLKCDWCKNDFSRTNGNTKKNKHGFQFCTRICKDKAQQIGGIKEIQPEHYKDGAASYSKRAIREYGSKCVDCDITMKAFLHVHHKDSNRDNGNLDNLEVVCSIHHMLRHMVFSKGRWVVDFKQLTPLDDLEKLKAELIKKK